MQSIMRRGGLWIRIIILTQVFSLAQSTRASEGGSRFEFFRFRILDELLYINSSNLMNTVMLYWTPGFRWTHFRLQGSLGAAPIRNSGASYNLAVEYGLGASVHILKSFWIEGVCGGETWTDVPTRALYAGGNLVFQLNHRVLLADQIIMGYTGFFSPTNLISEFKLGVGIKF